MRLHLDENVAHAVAHGLRLRGMDVTTTADAGLLGSSDTDQLAFAVRNRRTIVTCDIDFLRKASGGAMHFGIIFALKSHHRHGDIVRGILYLAAQSTGADLANQVVFLSDLLRHEAT